MDFNGVCNVSQAGDQEVSGIHPVTSQYLKDFLRTQGDRGFRVGITSYIGRKGDRSQERRRGLINAVRDFNQGETDSRKKLGVCIVDRPDQKADFLKAAKADGHVDDRLDILDQTRRQVEGIVTVWVTTRRHCRDHAICTSLPEALTIVQSRCRASLKPAPFQNFWVIP